MLRTARKSMPARSAKSPRERETDRQTDRQTDIREADRQTEYITVIIAFVVVMLSSSSLEFYCWEHVLCEQAL